MRLNESNTPVDVFMGSVYRDIRKVASLGSQEWTAAGHSCSLNKKII